jgi:hypothetical protein
LLKKNTVFVIGAGASKEFDLPVGTELAIAISDKLNIRFDDFQQKLVSGDLELFRNVSNGKDPGFMQQAAWLKHVKYNGHDRTPCLIIAVNHPFYGICRRTGGELDHTVAKRFSRRSAMPPFETYWSRPLGNAASGRVQFRPPTITRHRTFIRQIGCLADRYLGSRRRNRSRRA